MKISDKKLLELIASKDHKAYDEFYERYFRLFYNFCFSRTNDKDISDEICQIFWIAIWGNPAIIKTDAAESAKSFLYKHFSFCMFNYFNSAAARKTGTEDLQNIQVQELSYTHILEDMAVQDIVDLLTKTIAEMPDLTREIFICRWEKGYSTAETAARLSISEQTVRARCKMAMEAVQKQLKPLSLDAYSTGIIALFFLMKM